MLTLPIIKEVASENSPSTSSGKCGRPCAPMGTHQNQRRGEKIPRNLVNMALNTHICNAYVQGLRPIGGEIEAKLVEKLRLVDRDT